MRLYKLLAYAALCAAALAAHAAGLEPTDITVQVETALRALEQRLGAAGTGVVRAELDTASVTASLPAGSVSAQARLPAGALQARSRVWVDVSVDGSPRRTVLVPVRFSLDGGAEPARRGAAVTVAIRVGSVEVSMPGSLADEWRPGRPAMVRTASSPQALPARYENGVFVLEEGAKP